MLRRVQLLERFLEGSCVSCNIGIFNAGAGGGQTGV
jgi:hypothetical protein